MSRAYGSFPFIPLPYVPYATRSVRRAIASRTTIVIAKAGTSAESHTCSYIVLLGSPRSRKTSSSL